MSRMRDDILSDPAKTDEKPAMSLGQTLADTFFNPRVGDGARQSRAELAALVDAAIAAEREACAKIADDALATFSSPKYARGHPLYTTGERLAAIIIAREIRSRNN